VIFAPKMDRAARWNRISASFQLISAGIAECLQTVLVDNILPLLMDDDDTEDDSDDDFSDEESMERLELEKIRNYYELTIPILSDLQFRQHFRLTRTTFENLQGYLDGYLKNPDINPVLGGRPGIDHKKMILIALWIMATPESYR
jgi:hypothetical protein